MRILITGAFGYLGSLVSAQALARGHDVRAVDLDTRRNRGAARKLGLRDARWGDIRDRAFMDGAAEGCDAVIHLAALLPPASERAPELCTSVNVEGSRAVAAAAASAALPLVFISSVSVMGFTQDREPPVRIDSPTRPDDTYGRSKVEAESIALSSGTPAAVLRMAAIMPTRGDIPLRLAGAAFEIPFAARVEVVVDLDAAAACLNAAEGLVAGRPDIMGKTFFIGGGAEAGCQVRGAEMFRSILSALGLPLPDERLFTTRQESFCIDWYDTAEAQRALGFQRHGFAEYRELWASRFRYLRPLVRLARPLAMRLIESQSPYRNRAAG